MDKSETTFQNNLSYQFRQAALADRDSCWRIIGQAKRYMASLKRCQWDGLYPTLDHITGDICSKSAYVIETTSQLIAYGAVIFTGEAAYDSIKGKWLSSQPYVVLHRLCVADEARKMGVAQKYFQEVEKLAAAKGVYSFKVDTNYDNAEMLHILQKCGFSYCGEVCYPQGSRMAFEKLIINGV